jgi:hypothetical protein
MSFFRKIGVKVGHQSGYAGISVIYQSPSDGGIPIHYSAENPLYHPTNQIDRIQNTGYRAELCTP